MARSTGADRYPDVPAAADDAEPDERFAALLQATSQLPGAYLPAVMTPPHSRWRRGSAWVLLVMLVTVTGAGICLTYGPAELWRAVT